MRKVIAESLDEALEAMAGFIRDFETVVGPPTYVKVFDQFTFRYVERPKSAFFLIKAARCLSGLTALRTLWDARLPQEQGVIKRKLDEISEDISCVYNAWRIDDESTLPDKILEEFWQEEFDDVDVMKASQNRHRVPRKKIRSYVAEFDEGERVANAERMRTIYNANSGYAHAAAYHFMMMYSEPPSGKAAILFRMPPQHPYNIALDIEAVIYAQRMLQNFIAVAYFLDTRVVVSDCNFYFDRLNRVKVALMRELEEKNGC